jgi:ATP-binding cassette subfamily C protein
VPVVTFQVALVLGLVGIMVVELSRSSIDVAIGAIAIFFGASLRIVPAVQRTVTLLSAMRQGMGQAEPTYRLARDLNSHKTEDKEIWFRGHQSTTTSPGPTDHSIVAQNVTFTYGQSPKPTLRNVSFKVPNNTSVALVGKTGAGKSTLVDILLGLLTPNMGQVELLGESPRSIIARNPGSVAYVPQQIAMFDLSIKENIALGLQTNSISDEEIWAALRLAQLDEFVMKAPQQLETLVGERGIRLSGGQRQRLGLARALLARPKVLFLDEATSSIDVETEEAVTGALTSLSGSITLFTIAHRLSTVRNAQHILFIDDGEILSAGSFEEVRSRVPQFAKHAELAGL